MSSVDQVVQSLVASFDSAETFDTPYRFWFLENCLPRDVVDSILALPFSAAELGGVSGRRELHNDSRRYFDSELRSENASVDATARAFQDPRVTAAVERVFGARLDDTLLRIEFAQDVDGFWLEPHTDIGVKSFTFLIYLSEGEGHSELGTDYYDTDKKWVGRTPFYRNSGMVFVPSTITYHGFEARPIKGVRKLLVVNYVTQDWRAREQLSFPDQAIRSAAAAVA